MLTRVMFFDDIMTTMCLDFVLVSDCTFVMYLDTTFIVLSEVLFDNDMLASIIVLDDMFFVFLVSD